MGFVSHENFNKLTLDAYYALLRILEQDSGVLYQQCPSLFSLQITDEHAMPHIKLLHGKHMITKGKKRTQTHQKNLLSVVCSCMLRCALRLRSKLIPDADHAK